MTASFLGSRAKVIPWERGWCNGWKNSARFQPINDIITNDNPLHAMQKQAKFSCLAPDKVTGNTKWDLINSWLHGLVIDFIYLLQGAHQMAAPSYGLLLLPWSSKVQDRDEPFSSLSLFSFSLHLKHHPNLASSQILQKFFAVPRLKKTKEHFSFWSICWAIFSG